MRLWESNYPRRGRTSREAISALRHADRRRHPLTTGTDGALGREIVSRASGGAQQACARCTYFIHAIEGHHLFFNSCVVKIALEKCDALCHDGMPGTRAVRAGLASWFS